MERFITGIAVRLREVFDPEALGAEVAQLTAGLVLALLTFAAFYLFWRLLDAALRPILARTRLDETAAVFAHTILKYVVLAIGLIQALAAAGINAASILASLGIVGLTIGFAARDALSNIISGLLIFWDRPFVIGDLVEVGSAYGRVERITLRSTRVVTPDGRMLAVPNSEIINTTVASYTNYPHLRLDIPVAIGVSENVDRIREVLLAIVRDDPDCMTEPAPQVVVKALNDYNTEVELQVWIHDEYSHIGKRFELREKIFEALTEAGVEMPFETIQLAPLEVRRSEPE